MQSSKVYKTNVGDRLERLPISKFHWKFFGMVTAGEWFDTYLLLALGGLLAIIHVVLHLSSTIATIVMPSSAFLGMFVGSFTFGRLADVYGRKTIYFLNLLVFGVFAILAALMSNFILIAAFMFLAGTGIGAELPLIDSFMSEIMPHEKRGSKLALAYTISVTAAPVAAYMAYFLTAWDRALSWRVILIFAGLGALVVWVIRRKMIESPRWLESQGRFEEADAVTTKIENLVMKEKGLTSLPEPTTKTEIVSKQSKFKDLFAPDLRKRSIMMFVFQFFQTGIFYGFAALAPLFLLIKGITLVHTLLFAMIIYFGFLVGSIVNVFIIDRVERKYGIIVSALGAGVVGLGFASSSNITLTIILGFLTAFFLWNFSNFFHQYQGEIFPTRLRATAAGSTYSLSRLASSILPLFLVYYILRFGLVITFLVIWIFVIIVVVDIWLFGPKSTKLHLESIAQ